MVKAVIFDLDDTLISEKMYIQSGYQAVSAWLAGEYPSKTQREWFQLLWDAFLGGSKRVFNDVLAQCGIRYGQEDIGKLVICYRNHMPNIEFYPDVLPCFDRLRSQGIGIGVLSDGYLEAQENKCKVLMLHEITDYVILTDGLGREFWKPHPLAYEKMKDYFQCEWEEMVYIADNPAKDFAIRATYPIHTIQIDRKDKVYSSGGYFDNILPEYKVCSLAETESIIKLINYGVFDFCTGNQRDNVVE